MRKQSRIRVPAEVFILGLCITGLVLVGSTRSVSVEATTCEEAYYQYYMADMAYDTARISWFYDSPTSCETVCAGAPQGPERDQCIAECRANRQNALAAADVNLFAKANVTCTPVTVDECAQARAAADACILQYPYPDYSDMDERLAVYEQYSACRLASKVDACQ